LNYCGNGKTFLKIHQTLFEIPGKHDVVNFLLTTFTLVYHFVDVNEMIRNRFTNGFATFFGFVYRI